MGEDRTRHRVGTEDDLPDDGSRLITEVEGIEVAVFRLDGEYHALANHCVHQAGPLCEGELRGTLSIPEGEWMWQYDEGERIVACPWHDWRFDVATGRNVDDGRYAVPTFEVAVEGSELYVLV